VATRQIVGKLCERCGVPLAGKAKCPDCGERILAFEAARAWSVYSGPLRRGLLSIKERSQLGFGWLLAQELVDIYRGAAWESDLVVCLPLARQRQRHRGYNQVELFAKPLARMLGLPFSSDALWRRRETQAQFDLSPEDRWKNVDGAFQAEPEKVGGRSILLVDDIMTTGATANESAKALKNAGAGVVIVLVVARTLLGHR
jgi:ComF family protein